jgi:hypothetical protein
MSLPSPGGYNENISLGDVDYTKRACHILQTSEVNVRNSNRALQILVGRYLLYTSLIRQTTAFYLLSTCLPTAPNHFYSHKPKQNE